MSGNNQGKVRKTVKCQGIIREKSGNFYVDDNWQPCTYISHIVTIPKGLDQSHKLDLSCFRKDEKP